MTGTGAYSRTRLELTPRMRDVLGCAAAGRSVKSTALELGISEDTVRTVRAALCARLGVSGVQAAILVAVRRGELS